MADPTPSNKEAYRESGPVMETPHCSLSGFAEIDEQAANAKSPQEDLISVLALAQKLDIPFLPTLGNLVWVSLAEATPLMSVNR